MKKVSKVKRFFSLLLIMMLLASQTVHAAECVDGSYLTEDEESTGIMEIVPYGMYLQTGTSTIGDKGPGLVAAGGTTTAQTKVATVKVSVMLERYVGGKWIQYTTWQASASNTNYVSSAKKVTVPTGFYYRVRCIHSANTDASSSWTNGLYM